MKPNRLFLIVGLLAAIFALAACQASMKPWGQLSTEQKAAFFLATYNDAYDSYLQAVKDPDYVEANRELLRAQRAVLVEMEGPVTLYGQYASQGIIPHSSLEAFILDLIARLGKEVL